MNSEKPAVHFHCSLLQLSPDFEGFRGLQKDAKYHSLAL